MPYVYLGATYGSYSTWGGIKTTIKEEKYTPSNLFRKYKHEYTPKKDGDIWIYRGSSYLSTLWRNYATLQPSGDYSNAKLQSADVYFNRFDTAKPLVLVLHFKKEQEQQAESAANGSGESNGKIENKYWKYSEFSSKIDGKRSEEISSLTKFENDQKLLEELIEENDLTNESLTYDLHEKGNGDRGTEYRNKISVSRRLDVNGGTQVKFYKHTHTPVKVNKMYTYKIQIKKTKILLLPVLIHYYSDSNGF